MTTTKSTSVVEVLYTNWRGETKVRRLRPYGKHPFWFGIDPYHLDCEFTPIPQWFFRAVDVDREEDGARNFALTGIHAWGGDRIDERIVENMFTKRSEAR